MKTAITNRIRSLLDALPAPVRNARWFMWPFFFVWFKGRHVREAMDFKRIAPAMSDAELRELYSRISTWAGSRPTDTNPEAMAYVLANIDRDSRSLLDVGTWHSHLTEQGPSGTDRQTAKQVAAERAPPAILLIATPDTYHAIMHKEA